MWLQTPLHFFVPSRLPVKNLYRKGKSANWVTIGRAVRQCCTDRGLRNAMLPKSLHQRYGQHRCGLFQAALNWCRAVVKCFRGDIEIAGPGHGAILDPRTTKQRPGVQDAVQGLTPNNGVLKMTFPHSHTQAPG